MVPTPYDLQTPVPICQKDGVFVHSQYSAPEQRGIALALVTRSVVLAEKTEIHAVVVDALDAEAKSFYERFGLLPLTDDVMRLCLPLSTLWSAEKGVRCAGAIDWATPLIPLCWGAGV
jgi:hypothetical protein